MATNRKEIAAKLLLKELRNFGQEHERLAELAEGIAGGNMPTWLLHDFGHPNVDKMSDAQIKTAFEEAAEEQKVMIEEKKTYLTALSTKAGVASDDNLTAWRINAINALKGEGESIPSPPSGEAKATH